METKQCVLCGKTAYYTARYTNEPLCVKHAKTDEQINYQKGKIDRYGNEIKKN